MKPSTGSGMLLLIDKTNGCPVGHVSAVANSNNTGWISMFIIDAAHRGKGMGQELFQAAMADAKRAGVKILGLDGVREQKSTCESMKRCHCLIFFFRAEDPIDERRRFVESPLGTVKIMMRPLVAKKTLPSDTGPTRALQSSIVGIRDVPTDLLVAHELKYTGFERPRLWSREHTFHRPDVNGFALVSKSPPTEIDNIQAWTVIRRCSGGVRIGPLYAQDSVSANSVLAAAMEAVRPEMIRDLPLPNEPISNISEGEIADKATLVVEVWDGNPDAENVFVRLGWANVGVEYHRMWVDGKANAEWTEGGLAQKGVFAIFDAAVG